MKKALKIIRGMIPIILFFMILGTAGALELDDITIGQAIARETVLIIMFYITTKKYMS